MSNHSKNDRFGTGEAFQKLHTRKHSGLSSLEREQDRKEHNHYNICKRKIHPSIIDSDDVLFVLDEKDEEETPDNVFESPH